ncbi:MAG TPA: cell division protein FtsL [Candidatus Angelobacter sp.]|jgi:cell division protein FtsL|nr:cell division protein FtsL [Candidatus Angelobacter sp.]
MAARAMNITGMITPVARRSVAGITPEFYFQKTIDNSRLVRVADPRRRREIRMFSAVVSLFFLMAMFYAWQHFRSLEYGYQIEAQKMEHERLVEVNRNLTLERSWLRDPSRIDVLARKMDLEPPHPGQVVRLDSDGQTGEPVIAQMSAAAVIPGR